MNILTFPTGLSSTVLALAPNTASINPLLVAGIVLIAIGIAYFAAKYRRYRATGERHFFERETKSAIEHPQGADRLEGSRNGQRNESMDGRNDHEVDGALAKGGLKGALNDIVHH
ncbi:MAG: hypothetical protein LBM66_00015 [Bifidobacteriaceae bacterium]|jgi:hypothetical protein|nr:hypothetical protein [Bifidobacteriaceae bacterium]